MEKTYKLDDGGTISATSETEFITKLRESSKFDNDCTDEQYMKKFAERYKIQTGLIIRTDTESNFVQDLLKYKFAVER